MPFCSFETAGSLVFADQFLQISTLLPSQYIYGLGEHDSTFLRSTNWNQFVMWNHDQPPTGNEVIFGFETIFCSKIGKE